MLPCRRVAGRGRWEEVGVKTVLLTGGWNAARVESTRNSRPTGLDRPNAVR